MLWLWLIFTPLAVLATRFGLANATLELLKMLAAGRFRIIVFRRFSEEVAGLHRTVVLPTVGAFGSVTAINDDSLETARPGTNADSEQVLADWEYLIEAGRADWTERVLFELDRSDFVIFHWPGEPTPAMLWEFKEVRDRFPAKRILWVTSTDRVRELRAWTERAFGSSASPVLGLDPDRKSARALRRALLSQLLELEVRPRGVPARRASRRTPGEETNAAEGTAG
jgi:hypothetical protein